MNSKFCFLKIKVLWWNYRWWNYSQIPIQVLPADAASPQELRPVAPHHVPLRPHLRDALIGKGQMGSLQMSPYYTITYYIMVTILYTIYDSLYTIHYTPYTIHHTLYIIHYTLHTIHCTLHTIHYTIPYYTILYYTTLYYTTLDYTILY